MATTVPADDLLYVLELVQDYCNDVMDGTHVREHGEAPLLKIADMINIGKTGAIQRPVPADEE